MKYLYLIPEEVRNAKLVRDELADVAKSGASNGIYLAWNFAVLVIGGVLGYFGSGFVDDNLLNAVIAFDGVIMGFVITAMLFSGRSQFISKMSYEQTALYAHKTRYMLMSQMNTLFAFLMCLLFCVLTMVASKAKAQGIPEVVVTVLVVMSSAFFALGCYRILLLPFQIYDVHSFALNNLVADAKEEVSKDIKSRTEDRLRLLK